MPSREHHRPAAIVLQLSIDHRVPISVSVPRLEILPMSPLLSASGLPLSVLDLAPIAEGSDAGHALGHALDLARHVEALGFRRFWLAEHHNMPGIASAATAVALAHVAAGTTTIRVGSGGIMLPNHAPLLIAEQFG